MTMVAKAGGYIGLPFKGYRGETQGETLSFTLFNLVVDALIFHWVMVVAATEEGTEGIGMLIRDLTAYFNANDGISA